ncbi:2-oxoglutarate translocator [Chelonobacter oris]|uniref:2-oxoglutarate translocator n=1 Tax=Chelonobacter oris TaxID=505317 RepID=A0A0A3AIX7_9PAST|nr:anion permease [Chelonobacter oris]KGQ69353.1 2-oxoglutarate translocator [Chelonobacter oris]
MTRLTRGMIVILVMAAIWLSPVPTGLSAQAWQLFAIFAATIIGFILQPLPLGAVALIGVMFAALSNTVSMSEALSGFSNSTIWLIVSAFLFAKGFIKTGLGRRIAYQLIRCFGSSALKLGYTLVISDFIISPATPSNTARCGGIMYPIVRSLASAFGSEPEKHPRKIGAYILSTTFQVDAPIAAMFLTACAPNLLITAFAQDTANLSISWGTWALAGIVPGLLSMLIIPYFIYKFYPPEIKDTREAQQVAGAELDKMGAMSRGEWIISGVFVGALLLWSTSQYTHIHATVVALLGVCVMLISGVLEWDEILQEKGAWDGMIWMGGIVGLAGMLNKVGFIPWFAASASGLMDGVSWVPTLAVLFLIYMYSHYVFASLSAHVTAMYAVFLAVAIGAGAPAFLAAFGFAALSNLMAGLTHYATGAAPIYFGAGYIKQKDWWRIGFFASVINVVLWIGVGSLWWNILGLW